MVHSSNPCESTKMKFLSYNIQHGKDQDDKYNLYRIAEIIQNADIACIQSAFDHWPLWMEMNTKR